MVSSEQNQKSIEDLILTILEPYRVTNDIKNSHMREWVECVDPEILKTEMDGIVDYVNERRKLYNLNCNIYESDDEPKLIVEEDPEKTCTSCNESKVLEAYYKRSDNVDGLEGICKQCYANRQKKAKQDREYVEPRNDGVKKCRVCKQTRDLAYFGPHNTSKDGLSYSCKLCLKTPDISNKKEKKCSACKEVKDVSNYTRCRTSSDGYFSYCGPCSKEKRKKYTNKRKEMGQTVVVTEKKCSM